MGILNELIFTIFKYSVDEMKNNNNFSTLSIPCYSFIFLFLENDLRIDFKTTAKKKHTNLAHANFSHSELWWGKFVSFSWVRFNGFEFGRFFGGRNDFHTEQMSNDHIETAANVFDVLCNHKHLDPLDLQYSSPCILSVYRWIMAITWNGWSFFLFLFSIRCSTHTNVPIY